MQQPQVLLNETHFQCTRRDAEAILMFLCPAPVGATNGVDTIVACPVRHARVAIEASSHTRTCNMVYSRTGQELHLGGLCQPSHDRLREAAHAWFDGLKGGHL